MKRLTLVFVFAMVGCGAAVESQEESIEGVDQAVFGGNGFYNIKAQSNGGCWNVWGGSMDNDALVGMWPCVGWATNERFEFIQMSTTSPLFRIKAVHSGKCLRADFTLQPGETQRHVRQAPCNTSGPYQSVDAWRVTPNGQAIGDYKYLLQPEFSSEFGWVGRASTGDPRPLVQEGIGESFYIDAI